MVKQKKTSKEEFNKKTKPARMKAKKKAPKKEKKEEYRGGGSFCSTMQINQRRWGRGW